MESWSASASLVIFVGVMVCIITERLHLTIAAMLGALVLLFLNILTLTEAVNYIAQSYATLALI